MRNTWKNSGEILEFCRSEKVGTLNFVLFKGKMAVWPLKCLN